MFPSEPTCPNGSCTTSPLSPSTSFSSLGTAAATMWFVLTCVAVAVLADRRLYPLLSQRTAADDEVAADASAARRAAFSATLALTVVLAETILGDLAGLVGPAARDAALAVVVPALLVLLVLALPLLQLRCAVGRARPIVLAGLFAAWLAVFWAVGVVLATLADAAPAPAPGVTDSLVRACLERVGIIGIALMALLSGFAAVSSPWHNLGQPAVADARGRRRVTEADIARQQHALDVTSDMLTERRLRLQALERSASASPAY